MWKSFHPENFGRNLRQNHTFKGKVENMDIVENFHFLNLTSIEMPNNNLKDLTTGQNMILY